MRRVGLIDNLPGLATFAATAFENATAAEVMQATGGNTGNVAFVHGAAKIIGNQCQTINWDTDADFVRSNFDHLVVCCANQIGAHADLGGWADRLSVFGLPVTLLGLGAQSNDQHTMPEIPEGTKRFLKTVNVLRHGGLPNIAVRGEFTRTVLETEASPSLPLGCPSLHTAPIRQLGRRIFESQSKEAATAKIGVAAGNPWHGKSAPFEQLLVQLVDKYRGDYILQHPESMLAFADPDAESLPQHVIDRFCEVYKMNFEELRRWYRRNACFFIDAPSWMRHLRRYDAVIGPRYHGVALAIQAGRPGVVVTIDSRTSELCQGTAIKQIPVDQAINLSTDSLVSQAWWTEEEASAFDANRLAKGRGYVKFLEGNGLAPSEHLLALVAA